MKNPASDTQLEVKEEEDEMQQFFTWFPRSSSLGLANSWCYDLVQPSPLLGPSVSLSLGLVIFSAHIYGAFVD